MIFEYFSIIPKYIPLKMGWFLIFTTVNSLYLRVLCAKSAQGFWVTFGPFLKLIFSKRNIECIADRLILIVHLSYIHVPMKRRPFCLLTKQKTYFESMACIHMHVLVTFIKLRYINSSEHAKCYEKNLLFLHILESSIKCYVYFNITFCTSI